MARGGPSSPGYEDGLIAWDRRRMDTGGRPIPSIAERTRHGRFLVVGAAILMGWLLMGLLIGSSVAGRLRQRTTPRRAGNVDAHKS